ncbi:tautomerase family protein [Streptomyces sp. NPDC059209]|uniref:tautomerase family protein n=1 Tax=Streptomyces sp. NPDC059209 TaxID=3346769 RepID=UPI0036CA7713
MPFVDITLARGKSDEYLRGVSRAAHDALVEAFGMRPDDDFQLIHQLDPGDMVFPRTFRGGPRTGDWIVFRITDGSDRGEQAKRGFYQALTRLLRDGPGVDPQNVYVMTTVTAPENFSFAAGVIGTDQAAAESLAGEARPRAAYTADELAYALSSLFTDRESGLARVLPMLAPDFVLTVPTSLPYGGTFTGAEPFTKLFSGTPGAGKVWESFDSRVERVLRGSDHLTVQLTNTGVLKATGKKVVFENLWLFDTAHGRITRAQLYADTAVVTNPAG